MTVRRRVLIADDHQIVRQGLRALLEKAGHVVVAEAANGREAVDLAAVHPVDIAVLDLLMPILNGVDSARELVRVAPQTRTILLTMHADRPYVVEAMQAGAKGYVLKTQAAEDLVRAIDEVSRGVAQIIFGEDKLSDMNVRLTRIALESYKITEVLGHTNGSSKPELAAA